MLSTNIGFSSWNHYYYRKATKNTLYTVEEEKIKNGLNTGVTVNVITYCTIHNSLDKASTEIK